MNTIMSTGPGMFAAESMASNPQIPEGKMHVCCARIDVYEMERTEADLRTSFKILFAQANDNKGLAKILLTLGKTIESNRALLEEQQRQDEGS